MSIEYSYPDDNIKPDSFQRHKHELTKFVTMSSTWWCSAALHINELSESDLSLFCRPNLERESSDCKDNTRLYTR